MILEQIEGNVTVILNGKTLTIGNSFDECDYSTVIVSGTGKAIFRIDPSCTVERVAVEDTTPTPTPIPVIVKETFTAK
jgi:hypothetical protein